MNVRGLLVGGIMVLGGATGCAGDAEKDLRYRESHLLEPLDIPAGLAPPEQTGYLEIPGEPAGSRAAGGGERVVDDRPPNILGNEQ